MFSLALGLLSFLSCAGQLSLASPISTRDDSVNAPSGLLLDTKHRIRDSGGDSELYVPATNLSIPPEQWTREIGDFKMVLSGYREPHGSPLDVNLIVYPAIVNWAFGIITQGAAQLPMESEWPGGYIDQTVGGYNYQLKPTKTRRGHPQPFTVLEVLETFNIFQTWIFAWSGHPYIPSADLTVRSVSRNVVIAKGRFTTNGQPDGSGSFQTF